jgi:hypothetical protein
MTLETIFAKLSHLLIRASKELHFIPSPPMGERVRVRGKAIAFPLPLIGERYCP